MSRGGAARSGCSTSLLPGAREPVLGAGGVAAVCQPEGCFSYNSYAMRSASVVVIRIVVLLLALPCVWGETPAVKGFVHGEGAAPGAGPDAREAAILNAQMNLVMERLEQLVPSRDFSMFAAILENAPAYFESYAVVGETHLNDATQVEIEGRLLDATILSDASSEVLRNYADPPRVVVFILERGLEQPPGEPKRLGASERKLGDALRKARFDIVDADVLREDRTDDALVSLEAQAPEEIAAAGRDYRADIVIAGHAAVSSKPAVAGSNVNKISTDLKLRVVRAIDGAVLAEPSTEAIVNSASVSEGANQALQDAADKVFSEVMTASVIGMLNTQAGDTVSLTIESLGQEERLDPIIALLQRLPGVKSVETAYASSGLARLKVTYSGRIGTLVDRLASAKFDGFHLDPHTVMNRVIMASIMVP